MANIKSQIKRIRTNLKAQERNKAVKSEVKSAVRATREAIASGDKEKATTALRAATRKLDKTNEKRRQRNKSVRSSVRTAVRRFRDAVEAGDAEKATELQRAASKALDKAASKGVIHKNQAANRKSAIAKQVAAL